MQRCTKTSKRQRLSLTREPPRAMVSHGREGTDKTQNFPLRSERAMSYIWSHTHTHTHTKELPKCLLSKMNRD